MAALLLDNESEAITYGRASLADILQNHVTPYGVSTEVRREVSGRNYAVVSGSSQWKALRGFTHRYGSFEPYFTREGGWWRGLCGEAAGPSGSMTRRPFSPFGSGSSATASSPRCSFRTRSRG